MAKIHVSQKQPNQHQHDSQQWIYQQYKSHLCRHKWISNIILINQTISSSKSQSKQWTAQFIFKSYWTSSCMGWNCVNRTSWWNNRSNARPNFIKRFVSRRRSDQNQIQWKNHCFQQLVYFVYDKLVEKSALFTRGVYQVKCYRFCCYF